MTSESCRKRMKIMAEMTPNEHITGKIFLIRARKVMLDRDLAKLYQVETKQL